MDVLDNLLDNIERLLQKLSNENEYREQLYEKYFKYRKMLETNPKDINLPYFLTKYIADLELYVNGSINVPPIEDYKPLPTIFDKEELAEDYNNLSEYADILAGNLEEIKVTDGIERIKNLTNHVQTEYDLLNYRKQSLDQKICGALFKLMMAYFQNENFDEAKETALKFGVDMRIYLVNYMKGKLAHFKEARNFKDAEYAWKFIYGNEPISIRDISLWSFIYRIEFPEKNTTQKNISSLPAVKDEKISLLDKFSKYLNNMSERRLFKQSLSYNTVEVKNKYTYCDMASLRKALNMAYRADTPYHDKRKKDIEVIFEDQIRYIAFDGSALKEPNERFKSHLISVKLPQSARVILPYSFNNCSNLTKIDMSTTNIEIIQKYAFSRSAIEEVKFSYRLRAIEQFAFDRTFRLKEIDLSNTCITEVDLNSFYNSFISYIKMPVGLTSIKNFSALKTMINLETLDFSCCHKLDKSFILNAMDLFKYMFSHIILPEHLENEIKDIIYDKRIVFYRRNELK